MRRRPVSILIALLLHLGLVISAHAQEETPVPPTQGSLSDASIQTTPAMDTPTILLPVLESPPDPSGFFFAAEALKAGRPASASNAYPAQPSAPLSMEASAIRPALEFMYTLAFRFARGPAAKEAGRSLISLLRDAGRLQEAALFAREYLEEFGPEWEMYRTCYDILSAAGSHDAALSLVGEMRKALPAAAKSRSTELAWMEFSSRSAFGDWTWAVSATMYLRSSSSDSYSRNILRLLAAVPGIPANQASLALFRANAQEGKFAEALPYARPILPSFSQPDTPRVWLSELGKVFFGAAAFEEGIRFYASALKFSADPLQAEIPGISIKIDRAHIPTENTWVMAYHMARLFQGKKDLQTAAGIFIELIPLAFSPGDSDSALWYWLDITMNTIAAGTETMQNFLNPGSDNPAPTTSAGRPLELAALSQAAALWKNPSFFEDIVAQYMRRLLRERAWDDVVRLTILMSPRLTPAMRGPLLYLSGRLIETGRASPDISTDNEFRKYLENGSPEIAAGIGAPSVANLFFSVLLRESGIEEHYRTLAAWRLGTEPPLLSRVPALGKDYRVIDAITRALPAFDQPPVSDTILAEALAFIEQSLDYGLDALAAGQVGSLSSYSPDSLFWMARTFAEHEQYYPALRIGSEVLRRALPDSAAIAYALLYPLAWNGHFRELTETNRIAEPLAYALVRSESMFNQRAVSRSGALGLSQLLPSTAAETARGLKMQTYNLTDPRDNLAIGMAYFGYMLRRFGERPARAMAAYNAGPGRMMQWVADWGALEDDILIELYPIAEPRQYTKNIIAAALHYGKLYYGIAPADMLAFLLEGKALPNGTAPSMAGESSAQQPPVPQTAPSLSPLSSTP